MNVALTDPFVLAQDYPETPTAHLRSGHSTCARFSRRGDFLASGRVDGIVVIFDVETNGVARKLCGHVRQIQSLSWSSNGRYLLSASQDWKVVLWDLSDGVLAGAEKEKGSVGGVRLRTLRVGGPVYMADMHPQNHLIFIVSLFEEQPVLVDATGPVIKKHRLSSIPKRGLDDVQKHAASDAKQNTTVSIFSSTGDHIICGTSKGYINIVETSTQQTIYSTRICSGIIIYLRLTLSGRDMVVNASDRVIRTVPLPNLSAPGMDPDQIHLEVEHKFQDVVNRLSWNHVAFSSTGEYVMASTYNNHDIYIWERNHGSLVKILEGPKEEHGVVEWHPQRPLIAACGLESGRIHIWSIISPQRWSALAPDFVEVEENVEYEEHEDEFDIHPQEEIRMKQLDLENEDVDVLTIERVKGEVELAEVGNKFEMPVLLDIDDSGSEDEYVMVGTGTMRRKSPSRVGKEGEEGEGEDGSEGGDGMVKKEQKKRSRKKQG